MLFTEVVQIRHVHRFSLASALDEPGGNRFVAPGLGRSPLREMKLQPKLCLPEATLRTEAFGGL